MLLLLKVRIRSNWPMPRRYCCAMAVLGRQIRLRVWLMRKPLYCARSVRFSAADRVLSLADSLLQLDWLHSVGVWFSGRASSLASQLPQFSWVLTQTGFSANPCGSELAHEGVSSGSIVGECAGVFVSKLSPTLGCAQIPISSQHYPCESWLANDGVGSLSINASHQTAFASRLAPTGGCGHTGDWLRAETIRGVR
ncbi:hypothetical protein D3C87_938400 [compost metagenome]